jgi:hypothetical protein
MHSFQSTYIIMKKLFSFLATLALAFTILILSSCNKQEEEPEDNGTGSLPNLNQVPGCYVQNMIASDLDPQYIFYYNDAFPTILEYYKWYNSTTGNVNETQRFGYTFHEDLGTALLDTVFMYFGDIENTGWDNWYTATIFQYTWSDSVHYTIESAKVYTNDPLYTYNLRLKGEIFYDFDDYELPTGIWYYDFTDDTGNGSELDNYRYVFLHDTEERLRELHYYNHNDVETYYEIHTPSPYYQPTQFSKTIHPEHGWQTRFAPATSTYYYQGTGTYTYEYEYLVNDDNYIVQQSWMNGTTPTLISVYDYECYD